MLPPPGISITSTEGLKENDRLLIRPVNRDSTGGVYEHAVYVNTHFILLESSPPYEEIDLGTADDIKGKYLIYKKQIGGRRTKNKRKTRRIVNKK